MTHQADARRLLDERGYNGPLIHNTNPLYLIDKPVRDRIVESYYWKEQCFGINEATLCDRAAALTSIGGTYGLQKPTPFLCLVFKLLQLLPSREIVLEYLHQPDFKYLTALAAFFIRLTWESVDVYTTLEPLLKDARKLRRRTKEGGFVLGFVDGFVDDLLSKERVCATGLRMLTSRYVLEDLDALGERVSLLGEELEGSDGSGADDDDDDDDGEERNKGNGVNGNGYGKEDEDEVESDGSG